MLFEGSLFGVCGFTHATCQICIAYLPDGYPLHIDLYKPLVVLVYTLCASHNARVRILRACDALDPQP